MLQPFLAPDTIREVGGKMALSIAAEADALALERVRATAVLDEAELTLAGVPFTQVVPTRLRLEDGYASIGDLHWDSLGNAIRASGGMNLTADVPQIDLAVNGGLDLRLLGAFATDIATSGDGTGRLHRERSVAVARSRGSNGRDERGAPSGHAARRSVGAGGFGTR